MARSFTRFREVVVFAADLLLLVGTTCAASVIRLGPEALGDYPMLVPKTIIFSVGIQIGLVFGGYYDFSMKASTGTLLRRLLSGFVTAMLGLWSLYYALPAVALGRGIFSLAMVMGFVVLALVRKAEQGLFGTTLFHTRLLVTGAGALADEIGKVVTSRADMGLELVGYLADDGDKDDMPGPVVGRYSDLLRVARDHHIDTVVVAPEDRRRGLPMMDLLACHFAGIEVVDGLTFYERHTQKVYVRQLNPSWFIFGQGFKLSPMTMAGKRLMDVVLGSIGLVLSMPIMALCGLLIKLTSPGPILYRQIRTGRNGKPFTIYKLRSMTEPGPHGEDARASSAHDPETWNPETARITGVGLVMRKLHIDELPQFYNVIKGEMSLVGPRPERPEYIARLEKHIPYYQQRHLVRPGIAGLAQIMYDYGASVDGSLEKLQYDLSYIRNLSLLNDVIIILKTGKVVLFGREERG